MNSLRFASCLTCLWAVKIALATRVSLWQGGDFVSANVGERLPLSCFFEDRELWLYWFKQSLGRAPTVVSSLYTLHKESTFYGEFKDNQRFSLDRGRGSINLTISNLRASDSATYYCAFGKLSDFKFAEGTTVSVRGSGRQFKIKAPDGPETECAVESAHRNEDHGAHWFRNSEEAHLGIIFVHGGASGWRERNGTRTDTCDYSFPENISRAGMDLCAVISCGYSLFRNRTTEVKPEDPHLDLLWVLAGTLAVTVTLTILLVLLLCLKMKKGIICRCAGSPAGCRARAAANGAGSEDAADPHYAALNADVLKRSRGSRGSRGETTTECVYSALRQHH